MKQSCLVLLLAGMVQALSAQPGHLVTTAQQHARWMEQLSRQPVTLQAKMIAGRLLADTLIVVTRPSCSTGLSAKKQATERLKQTHEAIPRKFKGIRMPLLLIDGYPVPREYYEPTPATTARTLAALIRNTSFERITLVNGPRAIALYGTPAANGILLMELKDRKQLQQFKAL
ncbi:hypothetical protein [Niabella sp.]|uniref:hypothetical protein n=1 Tax=Niabella sp. TaxID=1962976 RepID=UPI00262828C3|nr:hypothetical protein [Niabella sp.]